MGTTKPIISTYLRAVLNNGIGRYVCQLQRITLQFCKKSKLSRGMRDFIEEDVIDFARRCPQVVLYVTPHAKYQSPKIVAEFLNGNVKNVDVAGKERDEILTDVELLRTESGQKPLRVITPWHTDSPSVQGMWHPFMHKSQETNLQSFPTEDPTYRGPYYKNELLGNMSPDLKDELMRLMERSEQAPP